MRRLNFKPERAWHKADSWFENHFLFSPVCSVYTGCRMDRLNVWGSRVVWTRYLVSTSTSLSSHDLNDFKKKKIRLTPSREGKRERERDQRMTSRAAGSRARAIHKRREMQGRASCRPGNCEISTEKNTTRPSSYAKPSTLHANFLFARPSSLIVWLTQSMLPRTNRFAAPPERGGGGGGFKDISTSCFNDFHTPLIRFNIHPSTNRKIKIWL